MRLITLCSAVLSLLVLSGCGGGGGGGSTTTASAGGAAPPPPPSAPSAPAPTSSASDSSMPGGPPGGYPGGPGGPGGPDDGYDPASAGGMPGDGYSPDDYAPDYSGDSYPGGPGGPGAAFDPNYDPNYESNYDPSYGSGMPDYGPGGPGYPGGPGGPRGLAGMMQPAKSLKEQAIDELRSANYDEGFRLLNVHYAVAPGGADELVEQMAWLPELRRPGLGAKIGIAALYVQSPRDFEGSPMPIGSKQAEDAVASLAQAGGSGDRRRGGNRRGQGGSGEFNEPFDAGGSAEEMYYDEGMGGMPGRGRNAGPEEALKQLEFHTGELGTKLFTAIKDRIASGQYGKAYQHLLAEAAKPAQQRPNMNAGYSMPGYESSGYDESYDPMAVGPGGPGMMPGGPGMMPGGPGMMPGGPGGPGQRGANAEEANQPMPLGLAVTWLGKATTKDELAVFLEKADCDVLVTYEITVRPTPRTAAVRFVTNSTKIRVANLRREKEDDSFIVAGPLENRAVLQERQKGLKGEDPVDKQVARALEALDRYCATAPLPAVFTEEVVKRRVTSLVAAKPADPLPALVETRFYVAKGLFPEEEYLNTAITLMGEAEFAELVRKVPDAGLAQVVGSAYSLPGLLSAVRGVNTAASAVKPKQAQNDPKAGGARSFLPFSVPGFGGGSKSGQQQNRSGYPGGPGSYPGGPTSGGPPSYPGGPTNYPSGSAPSGPPNYGPGGPAGPGGAVP